MRITTHHPELTESGLVRCEDGGLRPPWAAVSDELRHYYDTEWGALVTDEAHIFERICLEGFQAGLSWQTILAKRPLLRQLFHDFDPDEVAQFTEAHAGCGHDSELPQDCGGDSEREGHH